MQNEEQRRSDKQQRDWDQTIGDLTKELKYVQGELSEKENIFHKVEQELRHKLQNLDTVTVEKSDLHRRLDDLTSELQNLQTLKHDKEEKLKL